MSSNLSFKIARVAVMSAAVFLAAPVMAQEATPDNWLQIASVASRADVQAAAVAAHSSSVKVAGGERTVLVVASDASPLARTRGASMAVAHPARFVPNVYNIGG